GVRRRQVPRHQQERPQHMYSLPENTGNKMIRSGAVLDVLKHNRAHLVRIYAKGARLKSSNYLPHTYWTAGAQLVAINWQTLDLGYMMNHAMFQRNGGSGYVLKLRALRLPDQKDLLARRTEHVFEVGIISAQQLPPPKDGVGPDRGSGSGGAAATVDPFIEVFVHVPDWPTGAASTRRPHPPASLDHIPHIASSENSSMFVRRGTTKS
ncbi:phosphatidylinositol-specific phospholipase C, partial [Mycena vulgaris]